LAIKPGTEVEFIGNPLEIEKLKNGRTGAPRYTTGNTLVQGMKAKVIGRLESPYRDMVLVDFGVCVRPLFPGPDNGQKMALHSSDYKLL
jgi:hypothetical protein